MPLKNACKTRLRLFDFVLFMELGQVMVLCASTVCGLGCINVVQLTKNGRTMCFSICLYSGVARAWEKAHFGKSTNRVWLDEVRCTGNELTLEQCLKSAWGEHNCLHSEDAGVSCSPLSGSASNACLGSIVFSFHSFISSKSDKVIYALETLCVPVCIQLMCMAV